MRVPGAIRGGPNDRVGATDAVGSEYVAPMDDTAQLSDAVAVPTEGFALAQVPEFAARLRLAGAVTTGA